MLWALLVVASYMCFLPSCASHPGVFRVPLTLKHEYNVTTVHSLQATNEITKHDTAAVEMTSRFMGPIVLGGQQFKVVFDSGSHDSWVLSQNVNKERFDKDGYDHRYYNSMTQHEESGVVVGRVAPFHKRYGSKEDFMKVSGVQALDTLNIGGIIVNPFRFSVVNKIEISTRLTTRFDGIIGLGYQAPGFPSNSVFTDMMRQGLLREPIFSVYMEEDGVHGEILFGSWDDRYFKYPLEVNDVILRDRDHGRHPWVVHVTKLALGDSSIRPPSDGLLFLALVDTGCSSVRIPPQLYNEVRKTNPVLDKALDRRSRSFGRVPCSARRSLPELKITLGSRVYVLSGEDYTSMVGPAGGSGGNNLCTLQLEDGVPGNQKMVIGLPFFRKYYTVFVHNYFEHNGPVIAFAEAQHPPKT